MLRAQDGVREHTGHTWSEISREAEGERETGLRRMSNE